MQKAPALFLLLFALLSWPIAAQASTQPQKNKATISTYSKVIRFLTLGQIKQMHPGKQKILQEEYFALQDYYEQENNPTLWVNTEGLTPRAKQLIAYLQQADSEGLDPHDFLVPTLATAEQELEILAAMELKISRIVLKYARYARGGKITKARLNHFFGMKPTFDDPEEILAMATDSQDIVQFLKNLNPASHQFQALRRILHKKQTLYAHKPTRKLEKQIIQLKMNMERWRLLPDDMSAGTGIYVWTNIPELKTRIIQNGKQIFIEKAIVGKVSKQTPIFQEKLEWIEFFPTWYIPNSIKRNDLLPRLRRGNTKTLERFNLKVDCGKYGRNPKTINWKKVNIHNCSVTQPPSRKNVLGDLKFKFPNKYSVYMHDTDDKFLFKRKRRYMSHGCVRVQHPGKMAQLLLSHDKGANAINVNLLLKGKRRMRKEVFAKPIPVYMTYFTMMVTKSGKLKTLPDHYGHDRRMASLFTTNTKLFPAPKIVRYKRPKRKLKKRKKDWREGVF